MKKQKRNKFIGITLFILITLVVVRLVLPSVIKLSINNYFEAFSPTIQARVDNVNLSILKGEIELEDIKAMTKIDKESFLEIKDGTIDIIWPELFRKKIAANVLLDGMELNITKELTAALKQHAKETQDKTEGAAINYNVKRLDIIHSKIKTEYLNSLTNQDNSLINDISVRLSNISNESTNIPISFQALLLNSGDFKAEGLANLKDKNWTIDSELLSFNLTELNQFLKKNVPLTFTKGSLDLYFEAKSEEDVITGYLKPFIKNLDVIKTDENFVNPKHWVVEVLTALSNITLESDQVVATRIPFKFTDKLEIEGGESLAKVFEHGFIQEQSRGIENSIELKQSQEAR